MPHVCGVVTNIILTHKQGLREHPNEIQTPAMISNISRMRS